MVVVERGQEELSKMVVTGVSTHQGVCSEDKEHITGQAGQQLLQLVVRGGGGQEGGEGESSQVARWGPPYEAGQITQVTSVELGNCAGGNVTKSVNSHQDHGTLPYLLGPVLGPVLIFAPDLVPLLLRHSDAQACR